MTPPGDLTNRTADTWSAVQRAELVLQLLRGEKTSLDAARVHGLSVAEVERWCVLFVKAGAARLHEDLCEDTSFLDELERPTRPAHEPLPARHYAPLPEHPATPDRDRETRPRSAAGHQQLDEPTEEFFWDEQLWDDRAPVLEPRPPGRELSCLLNFGTFHDGDD